MFSVFFKRGKKRRVFQRATALLLLTLSFADMAIIDVFLPELCEREGAIVAVADAIIASNKDNAKHLTDASDTKNHESSSPLAVDEDCFCCCSHILPTSHFNFPALSIRSEQVISVMTFLPTSPPLQLYRPPRIA